LMVVVVVLLQLLRLLLILLPPPLQVDMPTTRVKWTASTCTPAKTGKPDSHWCTDTPQVRRLLVLLVLLQLVLLPLVVWWLLVLMLLVLALPLTLLLTVQPECQAATAMPAGR